MKISVIIPTYRRADFLGRAVQSVLLQDWPDLEVVVSDDNGPDSPHRAEAISVLEKIGDKRVRIVLPDRHLGGSGARNAGIEAAQGDLITFLDDDDIYLPHKLSRQAEFMARGFDMCFMDAVMRDASGVDRERFRHDLPADPGQEALLREHLLRHLTPTAGYMFTREAMKRVGGFEDRVTAQEFVLMLRSIEKGLRIGYLPEALVAQYRHEGERISTGKGKIKGEKMLYALKKTYFSRLSRRDRSSIRVRHYATLFYVYYLNHSYLRALICGAASVLLSPAQALDLWREKKNITKG